MAQPATAADTALDTMPQWQNLNQSKKAISLDDLFPKPTLIDLDTVATFLELHSGTKLAIGNNGEEFLRPYVLDWLRYQLLQNAQVKGYWQHSGGIPDLRTEKGLLKSIHTVTTVLFIEPENKITGEFNNEKLQQLQEEYKKHLHEQGLKTANNRLNIKTAGQLTIKDQIEIRARYQAQIVKPLENEIFQKILDSGKYELNTENETLLRHAAHVTAERVAATAGVAAGDLSQYNPSIDSAVHAAYAHTEEGKLIDIPEVKQVVNHFVQEVFVPDVAKGAHALSAALTELKSEKETVAAIFKESGISLSGTQIEEAVKLIKTQLEQKTPPQTPDSIRQALNKAGNFLNTDLSPEAITAPVAAQTEPIDIRKKTEEYLERNGVSREKAARAAERLQTNLINAAESNTQVVQDVLTQTARQLHIDLKPQDVQQIVSHTTVTPSNQVTDQLQTYFVQQGVNQATATQAAATIAEKLSQTPAITTKTVTQVIHDTSKQYNLGLEQKPVSLPAIKSITQAVQTAQVTGTPLTQLQHLQSIQAAVVHPEVQEAVTKHFASLGVKEGKVTEAVAVFNRELAKSGTVSQQSVTQALSKATEYVNVPLTAQPTVAATIVSSATKSQTTPPVSVVNTPQIKEQLTAFLSQKTNDQAVIAKVLQSVDTNLANAGTITPQRVSSVIIQTGHEYGLHLEREPIPLPIVRTIAKVSQTPQTANVPVANVQAIQQSLQTHLEQQGMAADRIAPILKSVNDTLTHTPVKTPEAVAQILIQTGKDHGIDLSQRAVPEPVVTTITQATRTATVPVTQLQHLQQAQAVISSPKVQETLTQHFASLGVKEAKVAEAVAVFNQELTKNGPVTQQTVAQALTKTAEHFHLDTATQPTVAAAIVSSATIPSVQTATAHITQLPQVQQQLTTFLSQKTSDQAVIAKVLQSVDSKLAQTNVVTPQKISSILIEAGNEHGLKLAKEPVPLQVVRTITQATQTTQATSVPVVHLETVKQSLQTHLEQQGMAADRIAPILKSVEVKLTQAQATTPEAIAHVLIQTGKDHGVDLSQHTVPQEVTTAVSQAVQATAPISHQTIVSNLTTHLEAKGLSKTEIRQVITHLEDNLNRTASSHPQVIREAVVKTISEHNLDPRALPSEIFTIAPEHSTNQVLAMTAVVASPQAKTTLTHYFEQQGLKGEQVTQAVEAFHQNLSEAKVINAQSVSTALAKTNTQYNLKSPVPINLVPPDSFKIVTQPVTAETLLVSPQVLKQTLTQHFETLGYSKEQVARALDVVNQQLAETQVHSPQVVAETVLSVGKSFDRNFSLNTDHSPALKHLTEIHTAVATHQNGLLTSLKQSGMSHAEATSVIEGLTREIQSSSIGSPATPLSRTQIEHLLTVQAQKINPNFTLSTTHSSSALQLATATREFITVSEGMADISAIRGAYIKYGLTPQQADQAILRFDVKSIAGISAERAFLTAGNEVKPGFSQKLGMDIMNGKVDPNHYLLSIKTLDDFKDFNGPRFYHNGEEIVVIGAHGKPIEDYIKAVNAQLAKDGKPLVNVRQMSATLLDNDTHLIDQVANQDYITAENPRFGLIQHYKQAVNNIRLALDKTPLGKVITQTFDKISSRFTFLKHFSGVGKIIGQGHEYLSVLTNPRKLTIKVISFAGEKIYGSSLRAGIVTLWHKVEDRIAVFLEKAAVLKGLEGILGRFALDKVGGKLLMGVAGVSSLVSEKIAAKVVEFAISKGLATAGNAVVPVIGAIVGQVVGHIVGTLLSKVIVKLAKYVIPVVIFLVLWPLIGPILALASALLAAIALIDKAAAAVTGAASSVAGSVSSAAASVGSFLSSAGSAIAGTITGATSAGISAIVAVGAPLIAVGSVFVMTTLNRHHLVTSFSIGGPMEAAESAFFSFTGTFVPGMPECWPTTGQITQGIGGSYSHTGTVYNSIDIATSRGTPVKATHSGVVEIAGTNGGYGTMVSLIGKTEDGTQYKTYYGHLATVAVRQGATVGKGQVIGTVDSTGNSTGDHLHYEFKDINNQPNKTSLVETIQKSCPLPADKASIIQNDHCVGFERCGSVTITQTVGG